MGLKTSLFVARSTIPFMAAFLAGALLWTKHARESSLLSTPLKGAATQRAEELG
jgi:hypothetical protein